MKAPRVAAALCVALSACGGDGDAPAPTGERASRAPEDVWFVDVTERAGLDFVHDAGLSPEKHLPETMGAGAAFLDADEDGALDLYLVQGGPMPRGGPTPGSFLAPEGDLPANRLMLGRGDGTFVDAGARAGDAAHTGYGMGVAAADADGDGHVDLYLTNLGPDALLRGDGRGSFRDVSAEAGIADGRWTSAATFFDADADGDLDLYVGGYVEVDLAHPLLCGGREPGWRSACHPDAYPGLPDRLWINDGAGRFHDGTAAAGMAASAGKALGVHAADFDGDGDVDVYTANDSVENRMWENLGDGTFVDSTLLSGTGVDERGATEAGMGVAVGDVDGDLDLDLFVTNFDDESNTLYENLGEGLFRDRTTRAGLDAPSRIPVGFGTLLCDFDLDGDLDLAVANGHIIDNIHLFHDGKTHAQPAQLFENDGTGRFAEVDAARAGGLCASPWVGRGLYAGDVDGDGDADVLLTQCGGPARLFENVASPGGGLQLAGLPVGTQVVIELEGGARRLREVATATSYFGQSALPLDTGARPGEVVAFELRVPGREPERLVVGEELPAAPPRTLPLELTPAGWRAR